MKTKYLFEVLFLLICIVMFSNCQNDNDFRDEIEKVKVYISAETDMYLPFGASFPIECMLVKEEKQNKYSMMNFSNITDFTYEKRFLLGFA